MHICTLVESFSWPWWLIVLVASVAIVVALQQKRVEWATFVVLAATLGLMIFGDFWLYMEVLATPRQLGQGLIFYVVGGLLWGMFQRLLWATDGQGADLQQWISWVAYWPWSLSWWVVQLLVRKIGQHFFPPRDE